MSNPYERFIIGPLIHPDNPEVCIHGTPVQHRCSGCIHDTRLFRARQATENQPATTEDLNDLMELLEDQIDDFSTLRGHNEISGAYLKRWQRAYMTVLELAELWDQEQDNRAEDARHHTWDAWIR